MSRREGARGGPALEIKINIGPGAGGDAPGSAAKFARCGGAAPDKDGLQEGSPGEMSGRPVRAAGN